MANIADITVKNVAGTDVIYNADVPSSGDKTPARWSQHAFAAVAGFRPSFQLQTLSNGTGDTRRAEFTFLFPVTYTDSATGLLKLQSTIKITGVVFMPEVLTVDQRLEAFTQCGNLLASTLIRGSVQNGYAPT